jgi:hypothetical protein
MLKCKGKIESEKLKKINEAGTIYLIKIRHFAEKKVCKNNIWFSKYNLYICGKLENSFFNFIKK